MAAGNGDRIISWQNGPISLLVHFAQLPRRERELDAPCLARTQMDSLKAFQLHTRRDRGLRGLDVKLDDFITIARACVAHLGGYRDGVTSVDRGAARVRRAITEARIAQAESERIHHLALEVAISSVTHRVISKCRQIAGGAIESNWQASRGIVLAGESFRNGVAAFLAGIPCLEQCIRVLVGPRHSQRAAGREHHNQRLARRAQRFEQVLLRRGKFNAGAVAAVEAVDVHIHLFAFKIGREADECDDGIGVLCRLNGLARANCSPAESTRDRQSDRWESARTPRGCHAAAYRQN